MLSADNGLLYVQFFYDGVLSSGIIAKIMIHVAVRERNY